MLRTTVTSTTPASTTVAPAFKPGDKVRVTRKVATKTEGWRNTWVDDTMDQAIGKEGEVIRFIPANNDVQVKIPGIGIWGFPVTGLEIVKTPVVPAPQVQDTITVSPRRLTTTALKTARTIAVELAQKDGQVTADGVQEELQKRGINLGNAIGSVFTGFANTGRTVKSTRQGNRGRRILVWALAGSAVATGATPAPVVPVEAGPFVVEVKHNNSGGWKRSWNKTVDGRRLQETSFATKAEAETEASRHQTEMRLKNPYDNFQYRVVKA